MVKFSVRQEYPPKTHQGKCHPCRRRKTRGQSRKLLELPLLGYTKTTTMYKAIISERPMTNIAEDQNKRLSTKQTNKKRLSTTKSIKRNHTETDRQERWRCGLAEIYLWHGNPQSGEITQPQRSSLRSKGSNSTHDIPAWGTCTGKTNLIMSGFDWESWKSQDTKTLLLRGHVLVAQSCLTLCDPTDYSPPSSSAHGIFQAIILQWVAISFSRGSSQPRDQTWVSRTAGRCFTI